MTELSREPAVSPEALELLKLLTIGTPHRHVYAGRDGGWFVTYGGGEVSAHAVRELLNAGAIQDVYSTLKNEYYHVGLTLDVERTKEERKKHRRAKDAPLIYVNS